MLNQKLLVGSHAPYWHSGISIREKSTHTLLAALPAVLMGEIDELIEGLAAADRAARLAAVV